MSIFKVFTLCVLICVTLATELDDSCSANQNTSHDPVMIPNQVLDQLTDISHKSKGLFMLWRYAYPLRNGSLLKDKVRVTSVHIHM